MVGVVASSAILIAGCGTQQMAILPRPPTPVNLTVYISNQRVLVSPTFVGAGPVVFVVTNQSARTQTLSIHGGHAPIATGPIVPQGTTQVQVNFRTPGLYVLASTPVRGTQAAQALPSPIRPAALRIGRPRPSADNQLLEP
jgi:hypothetical protein